MLHDHTENNTSHIFCLNSHHMPIYAFIIIFKTILKFRVYYSNYIQKEYEGQRRKATGSGKQTDPLGCQA